MNYTLAYSFSWVGSLPWWQPVGVFFGVWMVLGWIYEVHNTKE